IGRYVSATSDGGFIITGETGFGDERGRLNIFVIKLDSFGEIQWSKTISSKGTDVAKCVKQSSDGNYFISGETTINNKDPKNTDTDIILTKIDKQGNLLWSKIYGAQGSDLSRCFMFEDNGGLTIKGYTRGINMWESDVYEVRVDNNGNKISSSIVEGSSNRILNQFQADDLLKKKRYVLTDYRVVFQGGGTDIYDIKIDPDDKPEPLRIYGETNIDFGNSILDENNQYYIVGSNAGKTKLVHTNFNGKVIWSKTMSGTKNAAGRSVVKINDNDFFITGHTESFGAGGFDIYIVKMKHK
ncbi:MAG: NAD(P)-dependent oxidoreductase, partial [Cyclobacteriaceae bacterium]|nr:NAD(P)-dependent oxidoreductase [Cyclobacteriaceae bacterium]